jgi:hypothetical protein
VLEHNDLSHGLDISKIRKPLLSRGGERRCLLVIGPGLFALPKAGDNPSKSSYFDKLLQGMVAWCIKERVIDQCEVGENLSKLLDQRQFAFALHQIEEHLVDPSLQQRCIKEVINEFYYNKDIYRLLVDFPFSGYFTTNYDTFIETAYSQVRQSQLAKFYLPSLSHADEALQNQEPFIVKFYGDIDQRDSLQLSHRLSGNSSPICEYQDQLRRLCLETFILFIGFEKDDADLTIFENLLGKECILSPHHLPLMGMQREQLPPFEVSYCFNYALAKDETLHVPSEIVAFLRTLSLPSVTTEITTQITAVQGRVQQPQTQGYSPLQTSHAITVFIAYAQKDYKLFERIKVVLTALEKSGLPIKVYEREVTTYTAWISQQYHDLETADLILLLVSWDFVACDYCHSNQMHLAINRYQKGFCWIWPILLSPCSWEHTPFANIPMLPSNGKPVKKWSNRDDALKDIYNGIIQAIHYLQSRQI